MIDERGSAERHLRAALIDAQNYLTSKNRCDKGTLEGHFAPVKHEGVLSTDSDTSSIVFVREIEGGIVSGDIGVYTSKTDRGLVMNLRGIWEFKLATDRYNSVGEKTLAALSTEGWTDITVPSAWESQGYGNYDGAAWYRKQFVIPKELQGEDLVILVGKIDDSDKTFLNGKLIGSNYDQYQKMRYYFVNKDQFKAGAANTLTVYVEDPGGVGGIYEGPVGFIKQVDFSKYVRWR